MDIKIVKIEKPEEMNFILGQSHFIKTVEDIHEIIVQTAPFMKFGLAFCEASGPCLVRYSGNDESLIELAKKNAYNISAGHSFIVFMENGFPINILNGIKNLTVVCRIFCATANPTQIIIAESEGGRGILGVIDGEKSKGIETDDHIQELFSNIKK
jgi:uncharacterized protein